jgi:hypothetical protein
MAGFLGMRGTGDWVTGQRPLNWREAILYLYPNGSAPLTAIMSKMKSEKVDDAQFNWWTKVLPTQRAAITGVYTDTGLSVAYVSGGIAGLILYVKMSAADNTFFRVGHQVLLRQAADLTVDVNVKVVSVVSNGSSSYIGVKLLENDANSTTHDLSDADVALIIGNVNPEGGHIPDALSYDPVKWYNYTQIFRTPLEITRTAMQTHLRTGPQYKESKREALELHSIEMEKAFLFGVPSESTGSNGKPERTTMGLIPAIKGGYNGATGGTVANFTTDTSYAGQTWLQGGEQWLDSTLETIFRYGLREKLCFAGSGALLGINRLIKAGGNFDYSAKTEDYGLNVTKWVTPFGVINIMTHPLFSYETTLRNSMVIFEPKNINYRFIQDTMYKDDTMLNKGGWTSQDGLKEEYLTECGLEYHHPIGWGYINGVGSDSTL